MKKRFTLILVALLAISGGAMAATYYGFQVAGVKVTSDNYSNITADDITEGKVWYDPNNKILYFEDVSIMYTSSKSKSRYCILNESCKGLRINFRGDNGFNAIDVPAARFNVDTYIVGSKTGEISFTSSKKDAISINNNTFLYINNCNLNLYAYKGRCINGNNSGSLVINNSYIYTQEQINGSLSKLKSVNIFGYDTQLTLSGYSSSAATVNEVAAMTFNSMNGSALDVNGSDNWTHIVTPSGASFNVSKKAIVTSSAPSGYKGDVVIQSEAVRLDGTNFPDGRFFNYVRNNIDKNGNGWLGQNERNINSIDIRNKGIGSLTGLSWFTNLRTLMCSKNSLTSLDVSKNTNLTTLLCDENKLTTLDVSKNTKLTTLTCDRNQLSSLNLSKNVDLLSLTCSGNNLSALDVSKNTKLTMLLCTENKLTALNVSKNTALKNLYCYGNKLSSAAMQSLVNSLPTITNGKLVPLYLPKGETNALITKSQVAQAKAKGWKTYYGYTEVDLGLYPGYDDTAVESIKADAAIPDGPRYNLRGQRVGKDYKGVVIVKGRKFVQ